MNIFEKIDMLLMEAKSSSKVKESDIPIHPEMETREQGKMSAAEKVLKLFQKLKMGSSGEDTVKDGKPEIPDDMIDPMLKERPKSMKDKTFEKNRLAGWDETPDEKIEKEVEVENSEEGDDFDDFDYRDNTFGDEEDDETETSDEDDRSEDEKLRDTIEDAIDSLDKDKDSGDGGQDGDDSGADWGDEQDGGQDQKSNSSNNSSNGKGGNAGETMSTRKKRLEDLKKSLDSEEMDEFNEKMEDIKNATDIPDDDEIVGGQIETPTDETLRKEMEKAGVDEKSIDKMIKEKNTDSQEDFSEEEMDKLRKQVIDGLEKECRKKGGSALASTIVKNSLKRKISNEEWEKILEMFLNQRSEHKGDTLNANKGYKFGHKNHLWRGAVLPTSAPSKGSIQNIYCFIDFSGSVNQNLVFTFLGKVIDLCMKLEYSTVVIYGFGERLVEPRIIDEDSLEHGSMVALSQTWEYITRQNPGGGTENFSDVAHEINKIKDDEDDAVILIFGDAAWENPLVGPRCLKYELNNQDYFDDICVLAYYEVLNSNFRGYISELEDIVGIKHIITSKASSIHD